MSRTSSNGIARHKIEPSSEDVGLIVQEGENAQEEDDESFRVVDRAVEPVDVLGTRRDDLNFAQDLRCDTKLVFFPHQTIHSVANRDVKRILAPCVAQKDVRVQEDATVQSSSR